MSSSQIVFNRSSENNPNLERLVISMESERYAPMLIKDLEVLRSAPIDPEWTYRGIRYALRLDDRSVLTAAVRTLSELAKDPAQAKRALDTLGAGFIVHRGASRLRDLIQMVDEFGFPAVKNPTFVAALIACFSVQGQYETSWLSKMIAVYGAPNAAVVSALVALSNRPDLSSRWEVLKADARKIDLSMFNLLDFAYLRHISAMSIEPVLLGSQFDVADRELHGRSYVKALDVHHASVADSALTELVFWMSPEDLRQHLPFFAHILASGAFPSTKLIALRALRQLGQEAESIVPLFETWTVFRGSHELHCLALERVGALDPARQTWAVSELCALLEQEEEADYEKLKAETCQVRPYIFEALAHIGQASNSHSTGAYRARELTNRYLLNAEERSDHRFRLLRIMENDSHLAATYIDVLMEIVRKERMHPLNIRRAASAAAVNAIGVLDEQAGRRVSEFAKIYADYKR